jgi:hypothetical protein
VGEDLVAEKVNLGLAGRMGGGGGERKEENDICSKNVPWNTNYCYIVLVHAL